MSFIQEIAGNIVAAGTKVDSTLGALLSTVPGDVFPDQFETYQLSLAVVGSTLGGLALDSLTFPVMPESLMMAQRYLMTVTPTIGGVFVDDFGRAPSPITLAGTFGKKLRVTSGPTLQTSTGYGTVKSLSKLVELSHTAQADGTLPTTILYNWTFNEAWEVVVDALDVRMDVQQNGIWLYQMQLRTLRPHSISFTDRLITTGVQTLVSKISDDVTAIRAGVQAVGTIAMSIPSVVPTTASILSRL